MQRGVGRRIGRIWSKGTNFQSTTQPGQAAGPGDPALPASVPDPDLEGAPGPKHPLCAHHRPPGAASEPETPRGARRAWLPPPARRPMSRRVLPSTGSQETCAPAGDPSAPEGHAPAAKKDPLLLPATLSSNQPPVPCPAPRECLLLSHG